VCVSCSGSVIDKKIKKLDAETKKLVEVLQKIDQTSSFVENQYVIIEQFKNFSLALIDIDRFLRAKGEFDYHVVKLDSIKELNVVLAAIKVDAKRASLLENYQKEAIHELDKYDRWLKKTDPFSPFKKEKPKILR
jgi:hypothetical protein